MCTRKQKITVIHFLLKPNLRYLWGMPIFESHSLYSSCHFSGNWKLGQNLVFLQSEFFFEISEGMCVCCQTRAVGEIAAIFPTMAKSSPLLVYKSTYGFPDLCRESSLSPEFKPVLNIVMTVSKQLRKNWWGDGMSMGVGRGCISTRTYPLHTFVWSPLGSSTWLPRGKRSKVKVRPPFSSTPGTESSTSMDSWESVQWLRADFL